MQKIDVTLLPLDYQQLIVREGNAEPIHVPTAMGLSGRFTAPAEYVTKRAGFEGKIPVDCTHVVFNYKEATIAIVVDEQGRAPITVFGALTRNPLLTDLGVNVKAHNHKDLVKMLRFKGHLFQSQDQHREFINKLMLFDVKTESSFKDANDRGGYKETHSVTRASSELTGKTIDLKMPIFEGQDPMPISLTVEIEPANGTVVIYLISATFEEMLENETKRLFNEQRPVFEPYVIIEK